MVWSLVQLRLANQVKVSPTRRVPHLMVEVEGMKTYAYFDVIKVFNEGSSYPSLLWIGWDNDSLAMIKFNKCIMNFENCNIKVIALMDSSEGRKYVKPVKEEVVGGWDHAYNILEDYFHPLQMES